MPKTAFQGKPGTRHAHIFDQQSARSFILGNEVVLTHIYTIEDATDCNTSVTVTDGFRVSLKCLRRLRIGSLQRYTRHKRPMTGMSGLLQRLKSWSLAAVLVGSWTRTEWRLC